MTPQKSAKSQYTPYFLIFFAPHTPKINLHISQTTPHTSLQFHKPTQTSTSSYRSWYIPLQPLSSLLSFKTFPCAGECKKCSVLLNLSTYDKHFKDASTVRLTLWYSKKQPETFLCMLASLRLHTPSHT